ncbi:hypothetical protein 2209_scaffold2350_00002 [Bacteriophage sp.]|nr:hypothetical protein 2209_scaffold2350_00002 [Bacteriophage sp.]
MALLDLGVCSDVPQDGVRFIVQVKGQDFFCGHKLFLCIHELRGLVALAPADHHPVRGAQGCRDDGNLLPVRHKGDAVEHAGDKDAAVRRPGLHFVQEAGGNLQALFLVDFLAHSHEVRLKGRYLNTGLAERPGVVELPGSKVYHTGPVVSAPSLQGRALQLAEVPPAVLREHALKEAVPQGGVALGVGLPGVPLPHEAVEAQIVGVGAFHVKVHG